MKQNKISVSHFLIEINSYTGPYAQKLLSYSLQSAFLGILFLVVSWAVPVPESCSFITFAFFPHIPFFSPVCQVFIPSETQKPNSSFLELFQLYVKYQAPCSKQLLPGDHLVSPGLVYTNLLLTVTVVLALSYFSKIASKIL